MSDKSVCPKCKHEIKESPLREKSVLILNSKPWGRCQCPDQMLYRCGRFWEHWPGPLPGGKKTENE